MTLREFSAIMERLREREELAFIRSAQICAVIANCNRDPKTEPFTPQDFLPASMSDKDKPNDPSVEEWNANMAELNAIFGGIELTK